MKKFLVLLMVLGIASMANAALVGSPASIVDGKVTWSIVGDQLIGTGTSLGSYDGYLTFTTGELTYDTATDRSNSCWNAAGDVSKVTSPMAGWYNPVAGDATTDLPDQSLGKWFSFNVVGATSQDPVEVTVYNQGTMTITPEPMTIALLGLGGLFLRRRK